MNVEYVSEICKRHSDCKECPFSDIFPDGVFSDFDLREKINSAVKSGVEKTDYVLENSSLK